MVIWITGISGSGKTTIAKALVKRLKFSIPEIINIDGDEVRELFGSKLGYDKQSRIKQIKRIQRLCLLLDKQNIVVLASALYADDELLKWNRENFSEYYEVYLNASLKLVKDRDPKGIYTRANKGLERNVVGIDIAWKAPKKPDLMVNCTKNKSVEEIIDKVINLIPKLKQHSIYE